MRDLVIDLTPTCVNRTAICHIALDTLRAIRSHFRAHLQYRGSRVDNVAAQSEARAIAAAFHKDLARWARHPREETSLALSDGDQTPRLYFDPIYTLYRPLEHHDVVFVLDLTPLTNPEWHTPIVARAYELAFGRLMRSRAKIVCISTHCATALRTSFAIASSEITTVPLYLRALETTACGRSRSPSMSLIKNRFILFVGSLETRKNLVGLINAFALSGLHYEGWRLVCAGGDGHGAEAIRDAAEDLAGVEMLGFVTDGELDWLYRHAGAFAYPSFVEGFGLPLLEAMAHGLACLASITGASKEVCGRFATLVDPYDVPAIAKGLRSCTASGHPTSRERVIARARRFTFERYFEALMPAFSRAAA